MNRWLLNGCSTWELGLLIVGAFAGLGAAGLVGARRFLPNLGAGETNDVAGVILGVLAAIYGIVLAFVIVSLYEDFQTTNEDVRTEATALATVYRDSRGFSPPVADKIRVEISAYIHTVTGTEWRDMAHGRENAQAWREINALYVTLQRYEPQRPSQSAFYSEVVGRVNDLVAARRARLNDAEESLPPTFEILLVGGAILMLAFTFLFGVQSARLHAVMVLAVAVLLGFNLLVALVLEFPFSGQVTVSSHAYTQGSLASFASSRASPTQVATR